MPTGAPEAVESDESTSRLQVLAGRVLDRLGRPVIGARGLVANRDGTVIERAESDGEGLLLLRPERARIDDAVVVVEDDGVVHWRPVPAESAWFGDVVLPGPASIAGRLALPDGTPAAGVELRSERLVLDGDRTGVASDLAARLLAESGSASPSSVVTDPLGRFELAGLVAGEHLLEARLAGSDGWSHLWISSHAASLVRARTQPVEEVLTIEALLVELAAVDRAGEPLRDARGTVRGTDPDGGAFERELELDPEYGEALLLLPAARELTAVLEGAGGLRVDRTVDLGDEPAGAIRIDLTARGRAHRGLLRGRAIAPEGTPLAASIDLWTVDGRGARRSVDVAPDAEGWLDLEPGRYLLRLEAVGDRDPRHPDLALPFARAELEIDLPAGAAREVDLPLWSGQRLELTIETPAPDAADRVDRVEVLEPGGWRRLSFYDVESGARLSVPRPGRPARTWRPVDPAVEALYLEFESGEPLERELDLPLDGDLRLTLIVE